MAHDEYVTREDLRREEYVTRGDLRRVVRRLSAHIKDTDEARREIERLAADLDGPPRLRDGYHELRGMVLGQGGRPPPRSGIAGIVEEAGETATGLSALSGGPFVRLLILVLVVGLLLVAGTLAYRWDGHTAGSVEFPSPAETP